MSACHHSIVAFTLPSAPGHKVGFQAADADVVDYQRQINGNSLK
jgi:hypothetical protein